jgi:hypothetical protein
MCGKCSGHGYTARFVTPLVPPSRQQSAVPACLPLKAGGYRVYWSIKSQKQIRPLTRKMIYSFRLVPRTRKCATPQSREGG